MSILLVAAVLGSQAVGLLALWLRLRAAHRRNLAYRQLVIDVLHGLPPDAEILDLRTDGDRLVITIATRSPRPGSSPAIP